MARVLHIKKPENVEMQELKNKLDDLLTSGLGLEKLGRIGTWQVGDGNFPSICAFQSAGEGGFIVEYCPATRVNLDTSQRNQELVDVSIDPIGTTGSLIHRVYNKLKDEFITQGYQTFDVTFNR